MDPDADPNDAEVQDRPQDQRPIQEAGRQTIRQEVRVGGPRELRHAARDRRGARTWCRAWPWPTSAPAPGFFTRLFAEKVGPTGKVYAVDIAPQFLEHIAADAKKRRQDQVVTILGSQDSTNLPRESVDLVFMSDVYHHLEKPEKTLASIRQALRPGGRLVVIEFDRVEGKSSAFVLKHVRASQAVFRKEIEAAGFVGDPDAQPPAPERELLPALREAQGDCARRQLDRSSRDSARASNYLQISTDPIMSEFNTEPGTADSAIGE